MFRHPEQCYSQMLATGDKHISISLGQCCGQVLDYNNILTDKTYISPDGLFYVLYSISTVQYKYVKIMMSVIRSSEYGLIQFITRHQQWVLLDEPCIELRALLPLSTG